MNIYSVTLDKKSIEDITGVLKEVCKNKDGWFSNRRLLYKDCLEEFDRLVNIMSLMSTDWAQGSFTTEQMKFIYDIGDALENDEVRRKFSI